VSFASKLSPITKALVLFDIYLSLKVLTYAPNLICYLRLALLVVAEVYLQQGLPESALCLYIINLCLDAVDGEVARRFRQARKCLLFGRSMFDPCLMINHD
jgi:phosphatidylserine synthase